MKNVKLDWAPILENQIRHLENLYPDIPVRASYSSLIQSLNENKVKSRVILSGINVAGYSFVTESQDFSDRLYGSAGFTNEAFATEDRMGTLVTWLEDTAKSQGKYVMINEIFNAEAKSESFLLKREFKKFQRDRMVIELSGKTGPGSKIQADLTEIPFKKVDPEAYSDAEFEAYRGSEDEILFNSRNRKDRVNFTKSLFKGKFGEIIGQASKILSDGSKISAAIICTNYRSISGARTSLLADVFVGKAYRGRGIARHLILNSLYTLKVLGFENLALWVSDSNPARLLYESLGFSRDSTKEIFYYK